MARKTHKLKTLSEHFIDVVAGEKLAEVRKNDRDFKNGDFLILQEFDGEKLTGRELKVMITHTLDGGQYGIEENYAVLSIADAPQPASINRIVNGWYQWQPNENCAIKWLNLVQIVQVIEGEVWVTGINATVSVTAAKKSGSFVRRINLSEK